jgi:hypothetical protein
MFHFGGVFNGWNFSVRNPLQTSTAKSTLPPNQFSLNTTVNMPPRLSGPSWFESAVKVLTIETSPFLIHSLHTQYRAASILSRLSDVPSAFSKHKRLGRGPSSGKGKTSGRGHKGQKQHGKVPRGFNGGQTKDEVVHGKRGDHNFARWVPILADISSSLTVSICTAFRLI